MSARDPVDVMDEQRRQEVRDAEDYVRYNTSPHIEQILDRATIHFYFRGRADGVMRILLEKHGLIDYDAEDGFRAKLTRQGEQRLERLRRNGAPLLG